MRLIITVSLLAAHGLIGAQTLQVPAPAPLAYAGADGLYAGAPMSTTNSPAGSSHPRWAAVIHGATVHFTPRRRNVNNLSWNNQNVGLALRYEWSPVWAAQAGTFRNSIDRQSYYLLADWTPLSPFDGTHVGAFAGTVNGYNQPNYFLASTRDPNSFVPAAGLTARVDLPRLPAGSALAARFVPRVKQTQSAFISFELSIGF